RRQHPNRRRLAGAVQSKESVQVALWNPQLHAVNGGECAEAAREAVGLNRVAVVDRHRVRLHRTIAAAKQKIGMIAPPAAISYIPVPTCAFTVAPGSAAEWTMTVRPDCPSPRSATLVTAREVSAGSRISRSCFVSSSVLIGVASRFRIVPQQRPGIGPPGSVSAKMPLPRANNCGIAGAV